MRQGGEDSSGVDKHISKYVIQRSDTNESTSVEPRTQYFMKRTQQLPQQFGETVSAVDVGLETDRVNTLLGNDSRAMQEEIQRVQDAPGLQ